MKRPCPEYFSDAFVDLATSNDVFIIISTYTRYCVSIAFYYNSGYNYVGKSYLVIHAVHAFKTRIGVIML